MSRELPDQVVLRDRLRIPMFEVDPMSAHGSSSEKERLRSLQNYAVLDTNPEAAFDRITKLAAKLLRVPIALITLVDERRQWFKSACGLEMGETSREVSFCAHTITGDSPLIVPNATLDQRFQSNPLVTGDMHIRFYAGAPLRTREGHNLGSLCVIDTQPRTFSEADEEILRDLAAIVMDELDLRLSTIERRRQSSAIYHVKSGVVMSDPSLPDNPIIFANPAFVQMTGYTYGEVVGRNCRFLQGPGTDPTAVQQIREAIRERRTFHGELLNYRADGQPFWCELIISPVFDESGQLTNFIGLQTDVTARKRMAEDLRDSFERLQKAEASRDSLTGMIIHDLRTPLTGISGFLDLLRTTTQGRLDAKDLELIEMAASGTVTLRDMITSILDVNRMEAGEMPVTLQPADLRTVVDDAVQSFSSQLSGRTLNAAIPSLPVQLLCDQDLTLRVLCNLISNAIKYTRANGTIQIEIVDHGECVEITIADNGSGIPAEYHAQVFEKYGQVDGRKFRHSTGLGLAFCKLAIEAQGGGIGLESIEGEGTTVRFTLPRRE